MPPTTQPEDLLSLTKGIDVSHWQGNIDWKAVAADGIRFAFVKVTEGETYVDDKFAANWHAMKQAGLARGAYHFFSLTKKGDVQAEHFLAAVTFEPGDLPPALDIEQKIEGGRPVFLTKEQKRNLAPNIKAWLDIVEKKLGCKPIIYTSPSFWNDCGSDEFGDYPLWIANYGVKAPSIPKGWGDWTFWQDTEQGFVKGVEGRVDHNQCRDFNAVERIGCPSMPPAIVSLPA